MSAAAGIVVIASDTERVLLGLRSAYVNDPFTWAIPGGSVEPGESPYEASIRELKEEMGLQVTRPIHPIGVSEHGMRYYSFWGTVPFEADVVLNWEHDAAGWFDLGALPTPLHWGTEDTLRRFV